MQIMVTEKRKAFYHFITTLCAIVGGVFTVAGIVDGLLHQSVKLAKKIDLGKQVGPNLSVLRAWLHCCCRRGDAEQSHAACLVYKFSRISGLLSQC